MLLGEVIAYYYNKPNRGLAHICPEMDKRRLGSPSQILYNHTFLEECGRGLTIQHRMRS